MRGNIFYCEKCEKKTDPCLLIAVDAPDLKPVYDARNFCPDCADGMYKAGESSRYFKPEPVLHIIDGHTGYSRALAIQKYINSGWVVYKRNGVVYASPEGPEVQKLKLENERLRK